jgi:ATP/ADP translocase/HEAT repeat protein
MNRILAALFGLRFGERRMALMMTAYHFLLLVTLYVLKPVRDSLFLSQQGAIELPFVFMLTTVAVLPVAALHVRAGRRLPLSRLINGVAVILVLNLLGLRGLVGLGDPWVYYLLYAWVSVYAVLVTSQFWLLANAVFTPAESKRIFPLLSAGAIFGAVVGGEVTGLLVDRWGMRTENLLLVGAGLLVVSLGMVAWVRRKSEDREERLPVGEASEGAPANLFGVVKTLRTSRHLQLIIGVIALAVITTTFVDYQFKTVAASAFPAEGELTSFMGRFYGRVSLIAFLVQVFLAPRLIRMLGVGGALALLPLTLALGAVGLVAFGGLWAATALRGADQSLKHSVDKTGRELLFVPIDLVKKKRVKVFVDLFFDQGMQGVAGLLLLGLTMGLGLSVQGMSVVVLGLLAAWLGLVVLARSSYINQFRTLLRQQEEGESEDERAEQASRPMSVQEVRASLGSRSAEEVVRGLERLENACTEEPREDEPGEKPGAFPVEALRQLLEHRAPEVRRRAIRVLREAGADGHSEAVAVHLEDADPGVRLEAARYLYRSFEGGRDLFLRQGLEHEDLRIRAAAVGLIAKDGGPEERALLTKPLLKNLVTHEDGEAAEEARLEGARALGVVDWPGRDALLIDLMDDPSPEVADRAVKSAGQTGDRVFVAPLLEQLQEEGREEEEARRSLVAFGPRILGTLYDYLVDEETPERLRRRIPSVLAAGGTQAAVDVLLLSQGRVPVPVWHEVVQALSHLRARGGEGRDGESERLRFPKEAVREAVWEEAARLAALGQVLRAREQTDAASRQALPPERLHAARRGSLERLCRLLGLRYPQDDLRNVYRGLTDEDATMRSGAVELLDNLLEWDLGRDLLPLLNDPEGRRAATDGPTLFEQRKIASWREALGHLLTRSRDPTLATCAAEAAAREIDAREEGAPILRERLEAATHASSRAIRVAAQEALGDQPMASEREAPPPEDAPPGAFNGEAAPERPAPSMS